MNKKEINKLIDEYIEFCAYASGTQVVRSESVPDFIGFLMHKYDIKRND